MAKILFFSAKPYDKEYFDKHNQQFGFDLEYYETHLGPHIAGLKSRQIGALGVDVYEQEEKLFFRDLSSAIVDDDTIMRLVSFPNVLITAHQAFLTQEALDEIAGTTLSNIQSLLNGKKQNTLF